MKLTKKIARTIVFPTMMGLGIDKILRSRSEQTLLNVMYHGVVQNDSSFFSPRHIDEKQFEKHLSYLSKNFEIISIEEAFKMYREGIRPSKKTITISFDDGFANNLHNALPKLEKYGVKATIFVSSILVEKMDFQTLWSEKIAALGYFYKNTPVEIDNKVFTNLFCKENNLHITDFLKNFPYEERDKLIGEIAEKYNLKEKMLDLPNEIWKLLNKDELVKLSKSEFIDIGSHAHSHYNLGNIDIRNAVREMQVSKNIIEETIGKEVTSIAYPDGSYNEDVISQAEKIGYRNQLAVTYKLKSDFDDTRILQRFGVANTTTFESNMLFLNKAFKTKGF
jgi:peptidoglycan/xylan/chitin deacetylase (PgdA/CDA1 family)